MSTATSEHGTAAFPPGPDTPPAEQLAAFTTDPCGAVERAAAEHGPVFTLHLGDLGNGPRPGVEHNGRWVFLTRPHQIRELHATPGLLAADANRLFFGTDEDSVGYVDGAVHRDRRARLQPMLSGSREYGPLIESHTARHLAVWPLGEPVALLPLLQALTAEIVTTVVCGELPDAVREEIRAVLVRTENADLGPDEAAAAEQGVKRIVGGQLTGCPRTGHLLGELADTGWAPDTVRDETFSLLYTGFSTTANTLSWVLAELRANPYELAAARAEADTAFVPGTGHRETALPRLDAVVAETLRLHPVSALNGVRMAGTDVVLDGHRIPAGTIVVQCAHLAQRDPGTFDQPDDFRPARHLDAAVGPHDLAPFGGGTRTCVGRVFALREMRTVLAMLLRELDLDPAPLPAARQEGIFMAPADRVTAVLTGRTGAR